MNIIEAVKSGRRFKRSTWDWIIAGGASYMALTDKDVLADDYELEPLKTVMCHCQHGQCMHDRFAGHCFICKCQIFRANIYPDPLKPVAEDCRFPYIPEKSYDGGPLFHCELQKGHSGRHNINEFWWPEIPPKPREARRGWIREWHLSEGVNLGFGEMKVMEILTCATCGHEQIRHANGVGACCLGCGCITFLPRPERP